MNPLTAYPLLCHLIIVFVLPLTGGAGDLARLRINTLTA